MEKQKRLWQITWANRRGTHRPESLEYWSKVKPTGWAQRRTAEGETFTIRDITDVDRYELEKEAAR